MIEPNQNPQQFANKLIEQDPTISSSSIEEQSMKIQQTVEQLDLKARASQRFAIRSIAIVVLCYLIGMVFNALRSEGIAASPAFAMAWLICSWAALFAAAFSLTRYWTIHRPRLEKSRSNLQVALFQELQQQINELRQEIRR